MSDRTKIVLFFSTIVLLVPLLFYGSITPCGIARKILLGQTIREASTNGNFLAVPVGADIANAVIDAMTPAQCVRGLIDNMQGKQMVGTATAAQTGAAEPMTADDFLKARE